MDEAEPLAYRGRGGRRGEGRGLYNRHRDEDEEGEGQSHQKNRFEDSRGGRDNASGRRGGRPAPNFGNRRQSNNEANMDPSRFGEDEWGKKSFKVEGKKNRLAQFMKK